ncbi:MAG: 5'/3'-nucleotidase SurE [bacterium]|nr:5'/3'-nucleotidase SurE [bacterium]
MSIVKSSLFDRILITNDDGIHAHGLKILTKIAKRLSENVWTVAPETEHSGASHSLTMGRPLRLRRLSRRRHATSGTPTDCAMLGVNQVMKRAKPTLVLSGVNHGANLGEDITYSGTVAAAMEATLLGIPAIALSLELGPNKKNPKWSTVEHYAPPLIEKLVQNSWPKGVFLNINFPDVVIASLAGVQVVRQGQRCIGNSLERFVDPQGQECFWLGANRKDTPLSENTDLAVVRDRMISITPLHLDLTHDETLTKLQEVFANVASV